MLLGVCAHGCVSDDATDPDEFREAPTDDGSPEPCVEVVYQIETVRSADGEVLSEQTEGTMDDAVFQRVGRPWLYTAEGEAYHEHAWGCVEGDGSIVSGYRVTREAVEVPAPVELDGELVPAIAPELQAYLVDAEPDEVVNVLVRTTDSKPTFPLLPSHLTTPEEDYTAAVAQRRALIEQATTPEYDCPPNPYSNCTVSPDCDLYCGDLDRSYLDADGCLRPRCDANFECRWACVVITPRFVVGSASRPNRSAP